MHSGINGRAQGRAHGSGVGTRGWRPAALSLLCLAALNPFCLDLCAQHFASDGAQLCPPDGAQLTSREVSQARMAFLRAVPQ